MRILVGVLAGRAVPGYSPVGSMVVRPRARVGVLVAGSPCAVARHGSKSLGPGGVGEDRLVQPP